ncbi:unnamed protein product [marine sediment metagenome]|uniref:MotA/TolQ/ExbB proton channel domain-containing protein n=1 Tax=marine sediment metagenome TaxID=412755 RepID=X1GL88_9ZZZZ
MSNRENKEKAKLKWDYLIELFILGLFVAGTLIVFVGVVFEYRDRIIEANQLRQINRSSRMKRGHRKYRKYRNNRYPSHLAELEARINQLEIKETIIINSATRTINFIIIAVGALLQTIAYVSLFDAALNSPIDSIL